MIARFNSKQLSFYITNTVNTLFFYLPYEQP